MTENEIAKIIVDLSLKIHMLLGPGLLESVYEEVLVYELRKLGFAVSRQTGIPVIYETIKMDIGFKADLIVENKVIVELKSVESIQPVHKKQLLTYLKLTNIKLGLLVNFNENLIKNGIIRIANGLQIFSLRFSLRALRLCEKICFSPFPCFCFAGRTHSPNHRWILPKVRSLL